MSMTAEGLRISRLLMRAGEVAMVPGRNTVVGSASRCPSAAARSDAGRSAHTPVRCFNVRRESRDGKGRRIVERWTETVPSRHRD